MWYGFRDVGMDTCWSRASFQTVFDAAVGTTCSAFDCSNTKICSTGCNDDPEVNNCTLAGHGDNTGATSNPIATLQPTGHSSERLAVSSTDHPDITPTPDQDTGLLFPPLLMRAVPATSAFIKTSHRGASQSSIQTSQPPLSLEPPGTNIHISARWGPMETSTVLTTPRKPAVAIRAIIVTREVDLHSSELEVVCALTDEDFSPRVAASHDRCHVRVTTALGDRHQEASCAAHPNTGICSVSIDCTTLLHAGSLFVRYGLDASVPFDISSPVTTHAPESAAEEQVKNSEQNETSAQKMDVYAWKNVGI